MKTLWICIASLLVMTGCASPSAISIFERERLAAQTVVTAEANATDISRYILARDEGALKAANASTEAEYRLRLSVAISADEGAALMAQFANGLEANRTAFLQEVETQMAMVERQRLTGEAASAINRMASKEATASRRAFDAFVETELPRIMEEATAAIATVAAHQERERIAREARRAQEAADRKAAEEEPVHEEPEPEPPAPVPTPTPTTPIEVTQ
jgi:hypothetical protein